MARRVTTKLIIAYLLTIVSVFGLLNLYGNHRLRTTLLNNTQVVLERETQMLAEEYGYDYVKSILTLHDLKKQLKAIDGFLDVRILLTNNVGMVFADTRSEERYSVKEKVEGFPESGYYVNTERKLAPSDTLLMVWEPIQYEGMIRGYVCMALTAGSTQREQQIYMDLLNAVYLLFIVILSLVFAAIYLIMVLPVYYLKKAALTYARGDFSYEMKHKLSDEYKEIGTAVQYLAKEVDNLEVYRKTFVANISHDLRSPLTSIKGYVEAMKDGTIPYEAQERYLDVILFETERLTKLTSDLLVLNAMDNQNALQITDFDINAVIKHTAESFEGSCTKKHLVMELVFFEKECFVLADLARIQQVLYNLIDNAIKFSNNDSSIVISTEPKGSKVFVSVKDSGIGIPKDSIKKIWERFYKTDLSRGKDKKGTGLGLPISKDIITAHNENINVISTEGVGTEFIFTLPLANG